MSIRTNFLAAAAVALTLASPATAEDVTTDTVVASVNGTEITVGHMIATKQNLPEQYQTLPDEVLFEGILEQLIQQAVLSQSVGDDIPAATELLIENERRAILAGVAIDRAVETAITDDAIAAAYEAAYAEAEPSTEFNASHILVESEDEAKELVVALEGGAEFAALAQDKSTGPSGPNGGSLGWFGPGMMVAPFEEAVLAMEVGEISAPIETQFGWHVIILNETRMKEAPALEEVRDELLAGLQQAAVEEAITSLTEAADVDRPENEALTPDSLKLELN